MTSSPDDPWADLYKDLDLPVSEPARPQGEAAEPAAEEVADLQSAEEDVPLAAAVDDEGFADDEAESEDVGPAGEEAAPGTPGDEEGSPKKRRRRRRRRKKKGDAAEGVETATAVEGETEDGESAEFEPAVAESDESDENEFTPELTRDLIANWNVPSWSEIVAGLYRPERG